MTRRGGHPMSRPLRTIHVRIPTTEPEAKGLDRVRDYLWRGWTARPSAPGSITNCRSG